MIYTVLGILMFFVGIFIADYIYKNSEKDTHPSENKISYSKLLKDPRWQKKRTLILKRDDYTCQWCGAKENLQVHHKVYRKYPSGEKCEPWISPDSDLITLCIHCHHLAHIKYKNKILPL